MKIQIKFSSKFEKNLKLSKKQNKELNKLFYVINKLANLEKLEEKFRNHSLLGDLKDLRECQLSQIGY